MVKVGRSLCGSSEPAVSGSAYALGKAGIAVTGFIDELHGLPSGLVGEAASIVHKVGSDDLAGKAAPSHSRGNAVGIGTVHDVVIHIIVPRKYHLLVGSFGDIVLGKQAYVTGLRAFVVVDGIAAGRNELIGGISSLLQIVGVRLGIRREGGEGHVSGVILTEGSFEQAEA